MIDIEQLKKDLNIDAIKDWQFLESIYEYLGGEEVSPIELWFELRKLYDFSDFALHYIPFMCDKIQTQLDILGNGHRIGYSVNYNVCETFIHIDYEEISSFDDFYQYYENKTIKKG